MFRMTVYCKCGRAMRSVLRFDAVVCDHCKTATSGLDVYRKWGGLIRSTRPKGSM